MRYEIIIIVLFVAVLLIGGAQEFSRLPIFTGSSASLEGKAPGIQIVYPKNADVIDLSVVGIRVNVTNFHLRNIVKNQPNAEGEGHIVYILDGKQQNNTLAITSFTDVKPGSHTLIVELRNNDNSQLMPPVSSMVFFRTT